MKMDVYDANLKKPPPMGLSSERLILSLKIFPSKQSANPINNAVT